MPSLGALASSLLVTAFGVAVIFRIDAVRGIVTGITVAGPDGKPPAGGRALYM